MKTAISTSMCIEAAQQAPAIREFNMRVFKA